MELKQKPDMKLTGLLPAFFSLIVFALAIIQFGINIGFYTLGTVIMLYSILMFYAFYRTKHVGTLISSIYMLSFASFLISLAPHLIIGRKIDFPLESKVLLATTILLFDWLLYLNFTRKLKWRGKEILELAAQNVTEKKSNFTERPFPTAKLDFSKNEIEQFARFFEKNLLGLCYQEENRIVFMPLKYKNEYFALYNPYYKYLEKTWIAINYNGNVSVNISKDDYLDYKDDLAFEQLCLALSDQIIEFMKLFLDGRKVRIIDKLDNLKLNVFT